MLYVFDWDGTLCNSLDTITDSIDSACRELGLPQNSPEKNRSIIGLGLKEALNTLYPELNDGELGLLIDAYRAHYLALDKEPAPLYEGTMDVLDNLKCQGHQLAVATGKSRKGLDRVLNHMALQTFFDSSRCSDEALSKPHPLMLEQILAELGCVPSETVMVGDTDFDLLMAHAAGVEAVGVSYGAHPLHRLRRANPARILDHLNQLLL